MACVVLAVVLIAVLAAHLIATRQWAGERQDLLREQRHLTNLLVSRNAGEAAVIERAQAAATNTPTPDAPGDKPDALSWT